MVARLLGRRLEQAGTAALTAAALAAMHRPAVSPPAMRVPPASTGLRMHVAVRSRGPPARPAPTS
jgi:hypothetical protein